MIIYIEKEKGYNMLHAWAVDRTHLCQFERRRDEGAWYFWMHGHPYSPKVFKGSFPKEYFRDACLAAFFIEKGRGLRDDVIVERGRNYVGLTNKML